MSIELKEAIQIKAFNELDAITWHDIAALRVEVFVVEQDSVYQDLDGKDPQSFHLVLYKKKKLLATLRILPMGLGYPEAVAIGRVVSSPDARGEGIGHLIMDAAIAFIKENYPRELIKLSAQRHLEQFYAAHGFQICGDGYLEDGIPHIPMKFQPKL